MDTKEAMKRIQEVFGSQYEMLGMQLAMLSMTEQPCDVTFLDAPPAIDVKLDATIHSALTYGAGAKKLKEILESIRLSNGNTVSISDIWTVNPMPVGGFSQEDLDAVDMAAAKEKVGPNGETLRKMISDTYHCESRDEEDKYLRRFIAS